MPYQDYVDNQRALLSSLRPLLLPGGVLSRTMVRLAWRRKVKKARMTREADRRRMSDLGLSLALNLAMLQTVTLAVALRLALRNR